MKIKIFLIPIFSLIFFFFEIAISFSSRNTEDVLSSEDNISFALKLSNFDSDFESTASIDILIKSFLVRNNIKGASVAITKNENLVYAKGFGIANKETGDTVQPGHLFRIASISKLITAVAILKLYENGELSLDSSVFGQNGILNDPKFLTFIDPRIKDITVKQLLNHTAGWSKSKGDPLFNSLYVVHKMHKKAPADLDILIEYALSQKLGYTPGTHYEYSNFGYVVLGKIIEKVSKMSYEDYVNMKILKPLDIKDMHIGRSLYHEKFPNEVMYFEPAGSPRCLAFNGSGQMVPMTYGGNNISLLGAAGGWIASAPELIKLICAIDGKSEQPDILLPETIKMMTDPDVSGKGLFGWRGTDKHGTWWRTGTLAGSTGLIVRQENNINWVILLNSSVYYHKSIHSKLSRTMFAASYRTKEWPNINLFFDKNQNTPMPIGSIPAINPEM